MVPISSAAEILVIIVSVVLSIFLIVAIVLAVYLIRLTAEVRRIAKSAQSAVDNIGGVVAGISRFTSPIVMGKIVGKHLDKIIKLMKKDKK